MRDGTFIPKLLNRVTRMQYVPSPDRDRDRFLAEHYTGAGWKDLSSAAKQAWVDLREVLAKVKVQTIAYVGAHEGEVALGMNQIFPRKKFYLIEPAPETFKKLVENVSPWQNMKCLNLGAGAQEEELDIFVDNFSAASSLLPYLEKATQEFPFLGKTHTSRIKVKPLDQILQGCGAEEIDMLIMDVQGYEDKVLQGATLTLRSCKIIISELSLQPLYESSSTFDSVYGRMVREGFYLRHLLNPIKGINQTILQIDGVFVRES